MRLGTYAEWQLNRPSTPRAVLAGIVREAAGTDISRLVRVVEGYSNEVYRIECTSGFDLVVRILRFDEDVSMSRSSDEAWAIKQASDAGVPTGDVLHLSSIHVDGTDCPVMVQRAVPGGPLSQVIADLSLPQRVAVLTEVGRLIARLGTVTVNRPKAWTGDVTATVAALSGERSLMPEGRFTSGQISRLTEDLVDYLAEVNSQPMVLSHGDLSAKHIFVSMDDPAVGPRVSGFIDFGDWTPAPPLHDLAVIGVRSPELDLRPMLDGYDQVTSLGPRKRLDLHTLVVAVDTLAFYVAELDRHGASVTADLIATLMNRLTTPTS